MSYRPLASIALADLELLIPDAFTNEAKYSVFFDVENAFPCVWKYLICSALQKWNLRGSLPLFLRNYLQDRVLQVNVASHHSFTERQENGLPQGSPLSGTPFMIIIYQKVTMAPPPSNNSLRWWVEHASLLKQPTIRSQNSSGYNQSSQCGSLFVGHRSYDLPET